MPVSNAIDVDPAKRSRFRARILAEIVDHVRSCRAEHCRTCSYVDKLVSGAPVADDGRLALYRRPAGDQG